jgi:hypothetical protein
VWNCVTRKLRDIKLHKFVSFFMVDILISPSFWQLHDFFNCRPVSLTIILFLSFYIDRGVSEFCFHTFIHNAWNKYLIFSRNILIFVVCDSLISSSLLRSAILCHVIDLMSPFFEHSVDDVEDVAITHKPYNFSKVLFWHYPGIMRYTVAENCSNLFKILSHRLLLLSNRSSPLLL